MMKFGKFRDEHGIKENRVLRFYFMLHGENIC